MRRSVHALLGGLTAAGLIAVAPATHAIPGTVIINGTPYEDPGSCMLVGDGAPMDIQNNTGGTVTVFNRADCDGGEVTAVISAGASGTFPGKSVSVG